MNKLLLENRVIKNADAGINIPLTSSRFFSDGTFVNEYYASKLSERKKGNGNDVRSDLTTNKDGKISVSDLR
ncbi:hypothetical protein ACT453_08875, partial [Bacillus sp. D-CC]